MLDRKCVISSEWIGLRTSNFVYWWRTKTRIADKCHDLKGQGRDVTWHEKKNKILRNTKINREVPTRRAIMRSRFEVKRSKVKVILPINVETESVSATNFKLGRRLVYALSIAMARKQMSANCAIPVRCNNNSEKQYNNIKQINVQQKTKCITQT